VVLFLSGKPVENNQSNDSKNQRIKTLVYMIQATKREKGHAKSKHLGLIKAIQVYEKSVDALDRALDNTDAEDSEQIAQLEEKKKRIMVRIQEAWRDYSYWVQEEARLNAVLDGYVAEYDALQNSEKPDKPATGKSHERPDTPKRSSDLLPDEGKPERTSLHLETGVVKARGSMQKTSISPKNSRVFRIPCHWHSLNIQHVV
jgi:hypothetical protein